jgi:hypothetical protein
MRTGPHQAGPGHVSASDPCLSKGRVLSASESRGPLWVVRSLRRGVRDPSRRPVSHSRGSWILPRGSVLHVQGSGAFRMGVRTYCWLVGVRPLPWPRGDPGAVHMAGQRVVCRATRGSCAGIASSYCSKGYPCFRVPTPLYIVIYHI